MICSLFLNYFLLLPKKNIYIFANAQRNLSPQND